MSEPIMNLQATINTNSFGNVSGQLWSLTFVQAEYEFHLVPGRLGWSVVFEHPHESLSTGEYGNPLDALHVAYHRLHPES